MNTLLLQSLLASDFSQINNFGGTRRVPAGHRELALENLALRQQLVIYKPTAIRPSLRRRDRFFWVGLAKIWAGWKQPLLIVGWGGTFQPCFRRQLKARALSHGSYLLVHVRPDSRWHAGRNGNRIAVARVIH